MPRFDGPPGKEAIDEDASPTSTRTWPGRRVGSRSPTPTTSAPAGVKPLRYFGRDLVLYRGDSGAVHVFDAFCGHLGAHLGYGGRVCGDDIQCPFHGWRWDCDGQNVEIPYSTQVNRSRRLNRWVVREGSGTIFLWHDPTGRRSVLRPPGHSRGGKRRLLPGLAGHREDLHGPGLRPVDHREHRRRRPLPVRAPGRRPVPDHRLQQ